MAYSTRLESYIIYQGHEIIFYMNIVILNLIASGENKYLFLYFEVHMKQSLLVHCHFEIFKYIVLKLNSLKQQILCIPTVN